MARVLESPEPSVSVMEGIIQEYRERINQALEEDAKDLREKAERDSSEIIVKAKEEAEKAFVQAKQEAKVESERIIAGAKEEAAQIVRKSREEAAAAQQESTKIINETRDKASQIIMEVVERRTKQVQSEFARAASEARNKTSLLLIQISKSVEQIIDETETNIKTELESLATVIAEAETKLQPLREIQKEEPEVKSKRAIVEEVATEASESEEEEPVSPSVADKRNSSVKESDNTRLFKGRLKLEMVPPFNQERLEGVPEWLSRLHGLKVISSGSRAGTNKWITTHSVDVEQPIPLLKILKAVPAVKEVTEDKGNIIITLK